MVELDRQPKIDMHQHALRVEDIPEGHTSYRYAYPGAFVKDDATPRTDELLIQSTLDQMDKHGIVKGFLSGRLDVLYDWVSHAPERFIPSPHFNAVVDPPSIEMLRREYDAGRLEAMGEISSQYAGIAPNDPILDPYFDLAEELDLPVLIHTLGIGARTPTFRSSLGNPLLLEEVLVKHTSLRLYVENAGWPFADEMIALMYMYPQVYVDVSTATWIIPRPPFYTHLKRLIDAELGDRIMFGSDQMRWPHTIGMAIESIESADFLTEGQKRDIFYNNACRFLRLEESDTK